VVALTTGYLLKPLRGESQRLEQKSEHKVNAFSAGLTGYFAQSR
jgi:hypothetical protein